jgi:hypothetical protein
MSYELNDLRRFFPVASGPSGSGTGRGGMNGLVHSHPHMPNVQHVHSPASSTTGRGRGRGCERGRGRGRGCGRGRGRGRGHAERALPVQRGSRYVEEAAEHSGEEDGFDEEPDEETAHDRRFINDDASSVASSRNGYRAPNEDAFERTGRRVEYHPDNQQEPNTKRARILPRELQPLQPLGLYCDYPAILSFASLLPRISHLVSPYAWYHHFETPLVAQCGVILGPNEFLPPSHVEWLQDQHIQQRFACLFGSYGSYARSTAYEPLRSIARMQEVGFQDEMHARTLSPVAEVISAHNVLNERDELDTQPCPDVSDEFVCKGDFVTERKLRACSMGGLPGLPSVVLFTFEESTSTMQVSESVLRIFKYWNLGASRPELLAGNLHSVQTEVTEFYKNPRTNTKSARVNVKLIQRDRRLDDRATLDHVHPALIDKLDSPVVHACRSTTSLESTEVAERLVNSLFECQLHIVPNRVRDSRGKIRFVVASILRIQSTVPGCDPLLALRGLTSLQGFSQELLNVTQHMVRMLHVAGDVSTDKLFDASPTGDRPNLASIGHEANLPLAFFNFLRLKEISSPVPSPFAADWMGQRIDVYNPDEVSLFWNFLKVTHHSRMVYYSRAALHTSQDLKDTRNAQRELPTTAVDWKLFFPGQHYRVVQKTVLRADFANVSPTDEQREAFIDWIDNNPDPTHVFIPCDGAAHTRGYVLVTQPTMRPEDNPEKVKLREQQAFKEGDIREDELQCVHYCSKRFQMYATFSLSTRDAYAIFLAPGKPYPSMENLRNNVTRLTTIEREYFAHLTTPPDQGVHMQRERMRTNLAISLFGHSGHPLHEELKALGKCSDTSMLLTHTHVVISNHVLKQLHISANAPIPQLKHAARFIIDLHNVDENPPTSDSRESIAQQHLAVHAPSNIGVVNDDAQAARREARQFCSFQSELNVVNHAVLRWLLLAHVSVWSSTLDGCYGYCIQICDMGNSVRVCLKKSGKFTEDEMCEWDKKMPGSGADMVWNIFGEYVNGFPKFLARTTAMREFASSHNFCELYQQKSLMSFKRLNGLVKNVKDCVLESMSEHNENMGVVGAMNELNKLEQDISKVNAIWPTIEAGLGQSGATSHGVSEKPFTTTLSGVVVNISVLNPLQLICLASNQLSVSRPVSVNAGSRVVPVTSGCDDELGRIVDHLDFAPTAPQERRMAATLDEFTDDIRDSRDPRKVDDAVVRRNMSMFLMEYLARVFALMHRGMCLKRKIKSGFGMFVWSHTKNCCKHLTTNLRKTTYTADDIMDRNVNGSLETLVFGKWVRSVLQTALHRRLMHTIRNDSDAHETQLQQVLPDAIKTFMFVSTTPAVLLSAIQLYLTLAILDVGVMLVSCMVLYYMRLPQNCTLDVLALVIRGHESDLTTQERQRYYDFAAFLHHKIMTSLVPSTCLVRNMQPTHVSHALAGNADSNLVDHCCSTTQPSVHICNAFFKIQPQRARPDAGAIDTQAQVSAAFAATQADKEGADTRARLFWAHAGPGTRIPFPSNKSNDRNHRHFSPLNECPHFYKEVRKKLEWAPERSSNFGAFINFLRTCKAPSDMSRYDLVCKLLKPWADETDTSLQAMHDILLTSSDWTKPILNERNTINATMLEWALSFSFPYQYEMETGVGLAADVLWLILSQALYAGEWVASPTERVAVVHTRNMSNAAQALVYLYLHTTIPKAAVPACCDGGVVLSEPSPVLSKAGEAIVIPYRARLHVDSGADGTGFLNTSMRETRNMRVIRTTTDGPLLISRRIQLLERETNDIGNDVVETSEICPFPPESVAHMLPSMPSLMMAFRRMHAQHTDLSTSAESQWALATRLFGSAGDVETLAYIPVALTQHALDEEVPCFTYKQGFCFVLRIDGPFARLKAVPINVTLKPNFDDETLLAHSTFSPLPLETCDGALSFPTEQLSHAMSGGLVLHNGLAKYRPPALLCDSHDVLLHDVNVTQLAFTFMPIVRFQALLMIELNSPDADSTLDMRPYQETLDTCLTVAVLNTHPDSSNYMLDGHYSIRFHDYRYDSICERKIDFVSASQCMLRDGRRIYYTFTSSQFQKLVEDIGDPNSSCSNRDVPLNARFKPEPLHDTFALECHYTLSHQPRRTSHQDTHVRIAFKLLKVAWQRESHTIVYADVPLFDIDGSTRLHVLEPDAYPIATHCVC